MTPEERDRLVRVEIELRETRAQLDKVSTALLDTAKALQEVLDQVNRGRGAAWVLMGLFGILGSVITLIVGYARG